MTVSSDTVARNEKNEFVVETGTVKVAYNFHGKRGPVGITVYNKSRQGIEIDWKRSAFIMNQPEPYYKRDLWVRGEMDNSSWPADRTFHARITRDAGLEFIPPGSFVTRTGAFLADKPELTNIAQSTAFTKKGATKGPISFTIQNSPFVFRSYLTFLQPGREDIAFTTDDRFYVSGFETKRSQFSMKWLKDNTKGNEFYLETSSGIGEGVLAMAAAVGAIVLIGTATR